MRVTRLAAVVVAAPGVWVLLGGWGRGWGGVEGVGFEGGGGGYGGDGGEGGGQGVAGYEDVLVGGAAAFGGEDVGEVAGGDFVDDADETFGPVGVACEVGFGGEEGGFFFGGGGGGWRMGGWVGRVTVCGVCETGFRIRKPGQVEGHDEFGDDDIEGGEGTDAPDALEGGGGEVGAVGEVEVCFFFFFAAARRGRRGGGGFFLNFFEGEGRVLECVLG